ncbi:site-2 protease family protein [Candidatus Parcubacteria bacterium]|nr:MAG: site-2 protease family protein [Candidatus Parcubacteria bacterium]
MNESVPLLFQLVVLVFSIIVHEVMHGYVADQLGDPTARMAGRLSLNPLHHIDPVGSVMLPLFLVLAHTGIVFGWAKPVPYNPHNLYKDYRFGPLKVALAGPASNLLLAGLFGVLARALPSQSTLFAFFAVITYINLVLAVLNLIPVPPLDGSKIFSVLAPRAFVVLEQSGMAGIIVVFLLLMLFPGILLLPVEALFQILVGVPFGQ